jgi:hypothetical protein
LKTTISEFSMSIIRIDDDPYNGAKDVWTKHANHVANFNYMTMTYHVIPLMIMFETVKIWYTEYNNASYM